MLSEFSLRTVVVTIECKVGETCTRYKETNSKSIQASNFQFDNAKQCFLLNWGGGATG